MQSKNFFHGGFCLRQFVLFVEILSSAQFITLLFSDDLLSPPTIVRSLLLLGTLPEVYHSISRPRTIAQLYTVALGSLQGRQHILRYTIVYPCCGRIKCVYIFRRCASELTVL
jgi:hypothetical protein